MMLLSTRTAKQESLWAKIKVEIDKLKSKVVKSKVVQL